MEFSAEQEDAQYGEKVQVGELEHPSSQEGQEEGIVQLGSLAAGFVTLIYSIYGRRGQELKSGSLPAQPPCRWGFAPQRWISDGLWLTQRASCFDVLFFLVPYPVGRRLQGVASSEAICP